MDVAPDSNRQERHAATSPPLPSPGPMAQRPSLRVVVAVTAICATLGGALGIAGAWAFEFGASVEGVLVSLGPAAAFGAAATIILMRRRRRIAPAAIDAPLEHDDDGEMSELTADDMSDVLNRRMFFERASALADVGVDAHCVVVIDVNRPNVLSEDPSEITEDPTSDAFGQLVAAAVGANVTVGRLATGGFGLVLVGAAPEQGRGLCERIRHFQPEGMETLTPSFGITNWLVGDESIDQALGRAEAALYRAKQRGGPRIEVIHYGDAAASLTSDLAPVSRR
jgi:GGDEF domain-containing protein